MAFNLRRQYENIVTELRVSHDGGSNLMARYALYFAPAAENPWWRLGSQWLGRCAASGTSLRQPDIDGLAPECFAALTADPRRYGLHATLKAPFRLANGVRVEDIMGELDDIASRQCSFALPPLKVTGLDDFLALTPSRPCQHIDRMAQCCVTRFDRFRAPLTASERARRSLAPLTLRERMFLDQWGYPYVLDRFRFHFSLSGSLAQVNEEVRARLARAAVQTFTAPPLAPLIFDAICIFEEPSPGAAFRLIHRSRFAHQGRLVYVLGPSGAGKDSVINWARERLVSATQVVFTQRTITRPAHTDSESHHAVTEAQFESLHQSGEFAMCWRAHGHSYAIGKQIHHALQNGLTVVVSGSRDHLPQALRDFPSLQVVHINAPPGILRQRLLLRGREAAEDVEQRLEREALKVPDGMRIAEIRNDGNLAVAGASFLEYLSGGDHG